MLTETLASNLQARKRGHV